MRRCMDRYFYSVRRAAVLFAAAALAACGGSGDNSSGSSGSSGTSGNPPPPPVTVTTPPSGLSYPSPQSYTVGVAITALDPTVTGTVTSYSVSPALPAGLSLDSSTGRISGTPSVPSGATSHLITATNGGGSATFSLTIAVNDPQSDFTVGGTVTGLSGAGLVLRNNNGDDLEVAANGAVTFSSALASEIGRAHV